MILVIDVSLRKSEYVERLVDKKLDKYLKLFGAVHLYGPKWCGKTWTALNHANSVIYMTLKEKRNLAEIDPKYIFDENRPQLIDEWQLVPSIWDAVRHECDVDSNKGKFILTGSTTLLKDAENEVYHTGTGRIVDFRMYPMSLYESGDSSGDVSILDMFNNTVECKGFKSLELPQIAKLIVRGGWPENINVSDEDITIIPKMYLDSIINKDINERKDKKRNPNKMRMLIRSLARNESSVVSFNTLVKDIEEYETEEELLTSRITVADYLSVLDSLYLTLNQDGFSVNYRSSKRIGKSPKRHLVDPSLSCASLGLNVSKLMNDFNTFGFMFESLVFRDLKIYMESIDGNVFYFRDNVSGDEVDAILEFSDSSYAAVEVKLSFNYIEEAKKSLMKFYDNVLVKPKFMCIIVGYYDAIHRDSETGIYIVPINALKP